MPTQSQKEQQEQLQEQIKATLLKFSSEFLQFAKQLVELFDSDKPQEQMTAAFAQFLDYIQQQNKAAVLSQWQLPEDLLAALSKQVLLAGPFQEHIPQEYIAQGKTALFEYQQALHNYLERHQQINEKAIHSLRHELEEGDQQIETLKQLHDLWVDCYEGIYSAALLTESYQRKQARLINAVMQLRQQSQNVVQLQAESMGLVSQKTFRKALKRQHLKHKTLQENLKQTLKKDLEQELRAELRKTLRMELGEELAVLKAELAELKLQRFTDEKP